MTEPRIECWFDFGSNYSWVAVSRLPSLAKAAGVRVVWRPFLLGPIFQRQGWDSSPFVLQKDKGAYAFMDTARQCAKHGIAWRQPSVFPRAAIGTMRVAAAFADEPWVGEYSRRVMQLNFAEDRDIADPAVAAEVLDAMGLDGAALVEQAGQAPRRARLRSFSEEALRRRIFGAPMFFAGDEMFWGDDRLEQALDAATRPAPPRARGPSFRTPHAPSSRHLEGAHSMPIVHVSMRAGKPAAYRQAILDSFHRAMREALDVPVDDQFMVIHEHEADNFRHGAGYLGVARSEDLLFIQITVFDTRTTAQKQALYHRAVELLADRPGVRPEDVFINVLEAAKENWSLGHGVATFL